MTTDDARAAVFLLLVAGIILAIVMGLSRWAGVDLVGELTRERRLDAIVVEQHKDR